MDRLLRRHLRLRWSPPSLLTVAITISLVVALLMWGTAIYVGLGASSQEQEWTAPRSKPYKPGRHDGLPVSMSIRAA